MRRKRVAAEPVEADGVALGTGQSVLETAPVIILPHVAASGGKEQGFIRGRQRGRQA
jgi:hypothetical protein